MGKIKTQIKAHKGAMKSAGPEHQAFYRDACKEAKRATRKLELEVLRRIGVGVLVDELADSLEITSTTVSAKGVR